jgi:Co/Zn/Cd efflux system component
LILKDKDTGSMEGESFHDADRERGRNDVRPSAGDHNLRSAYLHVPTDALTSLLAIFALLTAKYFALVWMDPLTEIVGAVLVSRWSLQLLGITSSILLDKQGPQKIREKVRKSIADHIDDFVADLHLWSIGPQIYAAEISIVSRDPMPPGDYKEMIPKDLGLVHITVEVHRRSE